MTVESDQKEVEKPALDFIQIFRQKFAAINPSQKADERVEDILGALEELGISEIKKVAEAIIFSFYNKEPEFSIWIKDSKEITSKEWPHNEVLDDLQKAYLPNPPHQIRVNYSALIIQDKEDKLYLIFDNVRTTLVNSQGLCAGEALLWLDLLEKDNIDEMVGTLGIIRNDNNQRTVLLSALANCDVLGGIREERHVEAFAKARRMTPE